MSEKDLYGDNKYFFLHSTGGSWHSWDFYLISLSVKYYDFILFFLIILLALFVLLKMAGFKLKFFSKFLN